MTSPTSMCHDALTILQQYTTTPAVLRHITTGLTNTTFLLTDTAGDRFILQRMHPVFSADTVQDTAAVLGYLTAAGWTTQQLVPTNHGRPYAIGHDHTIWRLLTYVAADEPSGERLEESALQEVGKLLARLHSAFADFDYLPRATIPHFHDTSYYMRKLAGLAPQLPVAGLRYLAADIRSAYRSLPKLQAEQQLIHGDPRAENILFRNNRPFTFIDFDAIMHGTIWMDIGDMLRGLCCDAAQTNPDFSYPRLASVIAGYYAAARPPAPQQQFLEQSLQALRMIALELAARFMIDVVEDSYFGWDSMHYASRSEHNIARMRAQWDIYKSSLR